MQQLIDSHASEKNTQNKSKVLVRREQPPPLSLRHPTPNQAKIRKIRAAHAPTIERVLHDNRSDIVIFSQRVRQEAVSPPKRVVPGRGVMQTNPPLALILPLCRQYQVEPTRFTLGRDETVLLIKRRHEGS